VALKIWEAEHYRDENGVWQSENIIDSVADDAIFGGRQDNSKDIAEQFNEAFYELDKKHGTKTMTWRRVGKGPKSRISGRLEMHNRLKVPVDETGKPTGEKPMLVFFKGCTHSIRTIPELLNDERNPEDVDSAMEDHSYDETRYACMSRPLSTKRARPELTMIQKHKQKLTKDRINPRRKFL
jgi:hypothetical protein